jgi:pyruvate dehydrogenase E2 component (dihydrolipoamide acetyltransferase)
MSSEVKLPRLGQGMEAGTIVKWLKSEGDRVEKGEPLYELDTDKATQEVEAEASGVLLKIAVESGEVPVGQTIAVIGEEGEQASVEEPKAEPAPQAEAAPVPESEPAEAEPDTSRARHSDKTATARPQEKAEPDTSGARHGDETATARPQENGGGGRVKASPLARRLARERGVELETLSGTGPDGRIVADDVEQAQTRPTETRPVPGDVTEVQQPVHSAEGVESVPLTKIRATIARRLTAAWEIPVFQLTVSADMTLANELVERARELNPGVRVTVTDLLTKICAMALSRHRNVNVQFTDEALLKFATANVGIAVAAPAGLVVPVIREAERLSLAETAQARADIVERARDGKLQQADLEHGTFTISNLGMFGVEQFTAILNPPQAAILAVGATEPRPVVRDGEIVVRPMMTMTLTLDHRAIDGADGADFLRTVKSFLEEPALAL